MRKMQSAAGIPKLTRMRASKGSEHADLAGIHFIECTGSFGEIDKALKRSFV